MNKIIAAEIASARRMHLLNFGAAKTAQEAALISISTMLFHKNLHWNQLCFSTLTTALSFILESQKTASLPMRPAHRVSAVPRKSRAHVFEASASQSGSSSSSDFPPTLRRRLTRQEKRSQSRPSVQTFVTPPLPQKPSSSGFWQMTLDGIEWLTHFFIPNPIHDPDFPHETTCLDTLTHTAHLLMCASISVQGYRTARDTAQALGSATPIYQTAAMAALQTFPLIGPRLISFAVKKALSAAHCSDDFKQAAQPWLEATLNSLCALLPKAYYQDEGILFEFASLSPHTIGYYAEPDTSIAEDIQADKRVLTITYREPNTKKMVQADIVFEKHDEQMQVRVCSMDPLFRQEISKKFGDTPIQGSDSECLTIPIAPESSASFRLPHSDFGHKILIQTELNRLVSPYWTVEGNLLDARLVFVGDEHSDLAIQFKTDQLIARLGHYGPVHVFYEMHERAPRYCHNYDFPPTVQCFGWEGSETLNYLLTRQKESGFVINYYPNQVILDRNRDLLKTVEMNISPNYTSVFIVGSAHLYTDPELLKQAQMVSQITGVPMAALLPLGTCKTYDSFHLYRGYVLQYEAYVARADYKGLRALRKQHNPQDITLFFIEHYRRTKEFERALKEVNGLLRLQPNSADILMIKAEILLELQRTAEASKIVQKIAEYLRPSAYFIPFDELEAIKGLHQLARKLGLFDLEKKIRSYLHTFNEI